MARPLRIAIVGFRRRLPSVSMFAIAEHAQFGEPPNPEHVYVNSDQREKRTFTLTRGNDSRLHWSPPTGTWASGSTTNRCRPISSSPAEDQGLGADPLPCSGALGFLNACCPPKAEFG